MLTNAGAMGGEPKVMSEEPKANEETPSTEPAPASPPKARRGFAAMDRSAVRAIARKGGLVAHARGKAHQFTAEEAREAGRKGGRAPHRARGRKIEPAAPEGKDGAAVPA
mgnify:CR=1 FL=1